MTDIAPLFTGLQIGDKILPNRIVMPPMVTVRGITTPAGLAWYGEHARGGVGLVIVEATAVDRFGEDLTRESLEPLVDVIHAGGALAAIQLYPIPIGRPVVPADLGPDEIDDIVRRFAAAARVCAESGFEGVEIHGAHGHFLNQFFSPEQNGRTDQYGGSLENRMRLALRVAREVEPVCSAGGMLLLYRHTPTGPGYSLEESLALAQGLVVAGVDVLDISPAGGEVPGRDAEPFKALGVPVIAVTELDVVERALEVLDQGRADLIAVGRGLIADPEWPRKVREGRQDDILVCQRCNEGCYGNLRRGVPIECSLHA